MVGVAGVRGYVKNAWQSQAKGNRGGDLSVQGSYVLALGIIIFACPG